MNYLKEECVEFKNPDDLVVRGILHHADNEVHRKLSIICLNTGLNDMVGWHRIQVKTSRFFAGCGYNVLRFDDTGIGDSEGEITKESIVEIFSDIETGLFVKNANAAVDYMNKRFPAEKIVFLGFCGGGLTAIHSAAENQRISGVIDVGGPVTLASQKYLQKKDPWEVKKNIEKYKSKMFDIKPWIRFLTGKGEYGNAFRSIIFYLIHKAKGKYSEPSITAEIDESINLNKKFFFSLNLYVKTKRPILFYYGEMDSATWEFKKYFWNRCNETMKQVDSLVTFIEVEQANHIFSDLMSQQRMKQDILGWLKEHFHY